MEVPGVTEEELRLAAIDAGLEEADVLPRLGPGEFTRTDWVARVKALTGVEPTEPTARRKLRDKVARGVYACGARYDPRTGRRVVGYWEAE